LDIGALSALPGRTAALETRATLVEGRVGSPEHGTAILAWQARQAEGGIAAAMALGGTVMPPDTHFAISFNLATYRGEQGFAGSAIARVTDHVWVSGGFAGSTVKGSTGGRAGVTVGR
jgi:hypothetical protein